MRYSNRPKRIVRLTESDLTRIIRRVILEGKGRYKGEGEVLETLPLDKNETFLASSTDNVPYFDVVKISVPSLEMDGEVVRDAMEYNVIVMYDGKNQQVQLDTHQGGDEFLISRGEFGKPGYTQNRVKFKPENTKIILDTMKKFKVES